MFEAEPPAEAGQGADPELLALAREIDAELSDPAPGADPGAARLPAIPLERELAGMFAMIGAGAGQFLPSVQTVLGDATCKALGESLAPVARKYGLDRYIAGFQWRIELQALFVAVPVAIAIRGAIAHDLAQYRAAAAQASAGAGGARVDAPAAAGPGAPPGADAPAPVQRLEPVKT